MINRHLLTFREYLPGLNEEDNSDLGIFQMKHFFFEV